MAIENQNGGPNQVLGGSGVTDNVHGGGGQDLEVPAAEYDGDEAPPVVAGSSGQVGGGAVAEGVAAAVAPHQQHEGVGGGENAGKENENFREVLKEGEKVFECNICMDTFDQASSVKRHITMKHVKHPSANINDAKKRSRVEDDEEENEVKKHKTLNLFSESILEEFEKSGMFTSTQVREGDEQTPVFSEDNSLSILEQTVVRARPENVKDACDIIKELDVKVKQFEEQLKVDAKTIEDKDSIISVKDDALQVFKGTVNSLEDENTKSVNRIGRLEKAMGNMKVEVYTLRDAKAGSEKNKKLEKDFKEAQAKLSEAVKKVEELTVAKASLEAQLVRMEKFCDLQQESVDRNRKDNQQDTKRVEVKKLDIKCKQFESLAGCTFGENCKFLHPTVCEYFIKVGKCPIPDCKELHKRVGGVQKEATQDCYFWISGSCRFSEADCNKGRHSKEKFGILKRRESFLVQGSAENVSANHVPVGGLPQQMVGVPQQVLGGLQLLRGGAPHQVLGGRQQVCPPAIGQHSMGGQQLDMEMGQQFGMRGHQLDMGVVQNLGILQQQQQLVQDGHIQGVGGHQPPMVIQHLRGQQPAVGAGVSLLGGQQGVVARGQQQQQLLLRGPQPQGGHQAAPGQQFSVGKEPGMEWMDAPDSSMLGNSMNGSWQGQQGMGGR